MTRQKDGLRLLDWQAHWFHKYGFSLVSDKQLKIRIPSSIFISSQVTISVRRLWVLVLVRLFFSVSLDRNHHQHLHHQAGWGTHSNLAWWPLSSSPSPWASTSPGRGTHFNLAWWPGWQQESGQTLTLKKMHYFSSSPAHLENLM